MEKSKNAIVRYTRTNLSDRKLIIPDTIHKVIVPTSVEENSRIDTAEDKVR